MGVTSALAQDWKGTEDIGLGDTATSVFQDRALGGFGEGHAYRFYAPAGTKIQASLAPDKGTDLEVELQVTKNGVALPILDRIKVKKLKVSLKKFTLEESGFYEYRVLPVGGTGGYTLKTKGSIPTKAKATVDVLTYDFEVVGPTQLKLAKVKGAKGTKGVFSSLTGPSGDIAIGEATSKLKKIDLLETGTYTLSYFDQNAVGAKLQPGEWSVQVKLKPPKSKDNIDNPTGQTQIAMVNVDPGDPHAGAAAPGYVGSNTCRECHGEYADSVGNSFHNSKMRSPFRQGAAGYVVPPVPDALFKAASGTDMRTAVAGTYGSLAYELRVSHVPGDDLPYKITVGNTTYDVQYVMGGNGPWKQRYVVKIGQSHYITPIQYNDDADSWSAYHASDWDSNGPTATKNSWERRCGACHATGILLSYDAATTDYLTGYAELNIGCEACHGAGQAHVASQSADDILNPRDLVDGTQLGVEAADLTCGQCHNRGSGGTPTGAPSSAGYPWKNGTGIFTPGLGQADFETFYTTGTGIFFRYKDNPMGFAPTPDDTSDDTHNASKQHHQQYLDLHNGPHAPDKGYDGACFDCHDAHADKNNKHMLAPTITRGANTFTNISNDNNNLCLSCHNGHGDFAGVSADDVMAITDESAPSSVVLSTIDHMADKAAMPIETAEYNPAGNGTGRCSKCHMPKMSKSAVYTTDKAGNQVGDIHSHMFWPVWPNISELEPITNSCSGCHPIDPNDFTGDVIAAWATDPDMDGTFHADTPRNFQNGVANGHSAGGGMACASCHTTQGFIDAIVGGGQAALIADADARTGLVLDSITFDKGITCEACHGKQADGTFAAGDNPLRIPAADLCGSCHMNETVQYDDYVADGEIVRHPMQQMMDGVEGGEVPGATYGNSVHSSITTCVDCHFEQGANDNHSFAPRLDSCNASGCHGNENLTDFNRTARADYDGDGTTEGIQDEIHGVQEILRDAIVTAGASTSAPITYDGVEYYLIDGDRSNTAALDGNNPLDAAAMRAIFNQYWTEFEGSLGVHNTQYALQLLQNSYEELTGNGWAADTGGVKR